MVIAYVSAQPAKGGLTRWVIGAERDGTLLHERYLSFTTLNHWKASLCDRHRLSGDPVAVKYRHTGYFDHDLLWVGPVKEPSDAGD